MSLWDVPGAHESGEEYGTRVTRQPTGQPPKKDPPKKDPPKKDPAPKPTPKPDPKPDRGEVSFALRGLRALAQYKTWRDKPMFREVIAAAIKVLEEVHG